MLYCKVIVSENLVLKNKAIHEGYIYIGPASLCPCPEINTPFLVITGDDNKYARILIKERSLSSLRNQHTFKINHGVIGKQANAKTWYTFNISFLNGVFESPLIEWCNSTQELETLWQTEVQSKKLENYIHSSDIFKRSTKDIHISIAQGDPLLTLKRSEKIIDLFSTIDLTLHPFALIWKESIDHYLISKGFHQLSEYPLVWNRVHSNDSSICALSNPSESEKYLDQSVQTILKAVNFATYQENNKQLSNLLLARKIVSGELDLIPKQPITSIIRERAFGRFKEIKNKLIPKKKDHRNNFQSETNEEISTYNHDARYQEIVRGHIDGFGETRTIRGWVDANEFGRDPSLIQIFWIEKNLIIGEAEASIPRPDLHNIVAGKINCGFSVNLKLFTDFSLSEWLDQPVTLNIIESKSGLPIAGSPWTVTDSMKCHLVEEITSEKISSDQYEQITEYLSKSSNSQATSSIRKRLLEISALRCCAGYWNNLPIDLAIQNHTKNAALDYGSNSESATRLELILKAFTYIIGFIDQSKIHGNHSVHNTQESLEECLFNINLLLKERSFIGLQNWEEEIWRSSCIPISEILIATIFLQDIPNRLGKAGPLVDTIASIAAGVYADQTTSYYLRSIIECNQSRSYSQEFIDLAHKRGDRFGYLAANYANSIAENKPVNDLFYYAAAIDFSDKSPEILWLLTQKLGQTIPQHIEQYPRQSAPRHWVDRLGFIANNSTQRTVNAMLNLKFSRKNILSHHEKMISIKGSLAQLIWEPIIKAEQSTTSTKPKELKRWLIVGEESLKQCWLYRVEQKKRQLEGIGCEVRCMNHFDLNFWECSHDILWADALVVCRLAATYPVLRAISFAKNSGVKVFAEIDDLIFTPEYPAAYESYGGSISNDQYKNLCIDYPLRVGVLNAADEVIVSTSVLSEYCRQYLSDSQKPIHILNNLPLDSLITVSNSLKNIRSPRKNNEEIQIVITSGTLSHKQILNETIFPVLANILASHSKVKLLVIGHIDIGSELKKFGQRIQSIPFSDYSTYLDLLTTSDIALVPLEVHPTTHGKSAIKWMEASLCGVTCICSPVRAYTDVISHGETGLIAETAEEWHQAIIQLMEDPSKMRRIAEKARNHANNLFDSEMGREFWRNQISKSISTTTTTNRPCKKVLVMNVFFAHQSIGGATRVAQDYVQTMLTDDQTNYEITVLCTEYNNWQSDPANLQNLKEIEQEPFLADLQHIDYQNYQQKVQVDVSHWRGARIIRLSLPPKVWSEYHDPLVEAFCEDLFISESFDLVQCHCCQLLTAAPLVVARRHKIPYEIVMHDAWWMSHQQFLVSAAGRLIDPADPLGHFDQQPSPDEAQQALQRRSDLYQLLEDAQRRIAVSEAFKKICESAGIKNVDVQVNTVTDMGIPARSKRLSPKASINNYNLCHIGGMSLHKGYQLLRQAVHYLPQSLPIQFTIIDHRLSSSKNNYESIWNGYHVNFIAPIPMDKMPEFYSEQDVLIAPSIWPESFGLVTREALSAGLWVIASDAGALAEPILNTPEKNGTVIQPNNLEDLVGAIKALPIDLNTTRLNGGK